MTQDVATQLKSISSKLSVLLADAKKETWVKPSVITRVTGWRQRDLAWARSANLVKTKKVGAALEYLLESIPNMFIINKT